MQIIDRVTRQPVSGPELQGEICLKTAQLFPGYLGLDSEVLDPEGYFLTGDLGYYDKDGIIHFVEQVRWAQPGVVTPDAYNPISVQISNLISFWMYEISPSVLESRLLSHSR